MKTMVIGSGGREHALAWKLARSAQMDRVFVAPGNGGTSTETKCQNVISTGADLATAEGQRELIDFARRESIDFTVVGPETPLAAGIVDAFRAAGLAIVGPGRAAARLEASKAYSKDFMSRYGVRAAASATYETLEPALAAARSHFSRNNTPTPLVVKADGLAAGKGVVVAETAAEAENALRAFMAEGILGQAGRVVVLEDFLRGTEVSVLAAVSVCPNNTGDRRKADGDSAAAIKPFIAARDHKRRFDGGLGPNTGGMGAIAPVPDFTEAAADDFRTAILEPTLRGLIAEGFDYRGFIFFGLMVDGDRCSLLEYNVRLGDPETQAVLPLMESDFAELCLAIIDGRLDAFPLAWKKGAVCAPVLVAEGYPGKYRKSDHITIDAKALDVAGVKLFHAGTKLLIAGGESRLETSGGRVAAIAALAENADAAFLRAYTGIEAIDFSGMGFRRDIGK